MDIKTIEWKQEKLVLIDCTRLPLNEEYIECSDYKTLIKCIKKLSVRGAPAIGVAAAYGVVLACIEAENVSASKNDYLAFVNRAIDELAESRPTAVNLFWALDRMQNKIKGIKTLKYIEIKKQLLAEANKIFMDDIQCNKSIGRYGNEIIPNSANILTHCNAGALATAGYGTALGVIRSAAKAGKNIHVFADETRPLLQGARLTAWELSKECIPVTLITDSMAGYVMKLGKVDIVITGADRIALNGDTANKIGTYSLSVLAKENGIPFYIAAPTSTIDSKIKSGKEINIEQRDKTEVSQFLGTKCAPQSVSVFNPAFDVTPNEYITGIITEKGILKPPYITSIMECI